MRNSKLLIAMGLVIIAVVSASHLAGAGEPKSSGYSIEVSVVEEAGGQYLAKAIVRGAGNAVLAAPALRAKSGASAQAESTGPEGSLRDLQHRGRRRGSNSPIRGSSARRRSSRRPSPSQGFSGSVRAEQSIALGCDAFHF